MFDKIPLLKIPKYCACCRKETRNQRPSKAEGWLRKWCAEVHFRLLDFSYWRCEFCVDCALEVGRQHFYDLEMQALRSCVVEIMCSTAGQKCDFLFDSDGKRHGRLHEADTNWEAFVEKEFPLHPREKERFALSYLRNPRVFWEKAGEEWAGIGKGKGWAFPILGIVRYAKPTQDLLDLEVCTRSDLERLRGELAEA